MNLRLIDHLCPVHADAVRRRWPIAGSLSDLFDQCPSCNDRTAELHPSGRYTIRTLPDLDNRTYEEGSAFHEAGHAVLGLAAGMPLNYVQVEARTDGIQDGFGGCVNWGDYSTPVEQWAAMCWAGQQAQMRWLRALNLDTAANVADVVNLAWDDTRRVLHEVRRVGLGEGAGWSLCEQLLDRWWPTVEDVAFALAADLYLPGDQVRGIAARSGLVEAS